MTQSGLMFALAGPHRPVTLVPVWIPQSPCFQHKAKLWSHFKAFQALPRAKLRRDP